MRLLSSPVAAPVLGYLLGTIPSADVAARVAGGPDLRAAGSGNPGAANAAGVLGPRFGLAVLLVDVAKGALAGRVGLRLAGATGAHVASSAAVIGHCYPLWNGFRGGKGVATSVGQVAATFPVYAPLDAAVAVATAVSPRWKQRSFGATSVASAVWVGSALLWWRRNWPTAWGPPATGALPVGALVSSAVIIGRFARAARESSATTPGPEASATPNGLAP